MRMVNDAYRSSGTRTPRRGARPRARLRLGAALALAGLVTVPAMATGPLPTRPSDVIAMRFFVTPGKAAYCYLGFNMAPENPILGCWTPNDGFDASVAYDTTRGYAGYGDREIFKGHTPSGYKVLRFGKTFRWRCLDVDASFATDCSPHRGTVVFTCTSRRTGLTCRNRDGQGFWLGRYRGHRVF